MPTKVGAPLITRSGPAAIDHVRIIAVVVPSIESITVSGKIEITGAGLSSFRPTKSQRTISYRARDGSCSSTIRVCIGSIYITPVLRERNGISSSS